MFEMIERITADGVTWPEAFLITVVLVLTFGTIVLVVRTLGNLG